MKIFVSIKRHFGPTEKCFVALHPRLVLQATVPEDARGGHQDPEDVPRVQRAAEIRADADRVHADAGHDQVRAKQKYFYTN